MKEVGPSSMNLMSIRSPFELEEFYRRWKAPVFTFCCLYLGDKHVAGAATSQAFLSYYKQNKELNLEQLPSPLLAAALTVVCRLAGFRTGPAVVTRAAGEAQPLTDVIANLAADERTVFILRTVLKMDAQNISDATGLQPERVHELWQNALKMLSATPASLRAAIQPARPAPKLTDSKKASERQDDDRSAWTSSRPKIEPSLKCGL